MTPTSRLHMTPSRASRMDYDMEDENDGQISAREPLQNSVQDFKDVYDNKHRYDKSQINVQKRTKTPSDKVLKKTHCYFKYQGLNSFLSSITLWIRTLFHSGGFFFQGTRLQPLQKPHYLGSQQGMDSMWPYHNKSETDTRLSAVDLRSGWLSRPGSVLAEDHPDFFSHTPREPGDLKSIKSGKSRLPGDYRLNRDWH